MLALKIQTGDRQGETIGLLGNEVTIGRAEGCQIEFDDVTVSRLHATLSRDGAEYVLTDAGSTSGTFVNGKPVSMARLQHGDQIHFGGVLVSYESSIEPRKVVATRSKPGNRRGRRIAIWLGCIAVVATAVGFFAKPSLLRSVLPGFRSLKPLGFFTTRFLPGMGSPISGNATMSPRDDKEVFLGIGVEVPSDWLLPTEEMFREFEANNEKMNAPNGSGKSGSREEWTAFDPRRFVIVLADGREFKGMLIRQWQAGSMDGFASRQWHRLLPSSGKKADSIAVAFGQVEKVAVVITLAEESAKPPFKLRYDDREFVAVPAEQLTLP